MTKKELRKISLQFRTLSSQMLKIDSEEEIVFIQAFYDFISETPVVHDYIVSCHSEDIDFDLYFKDFGYHERIILPANQQELIDFEYQLMHYILEGKRHLYWYGERYTSSNKYVDMVSAFMRKVVEPFVVALKNYLELKIMDCPEDEPTADNTITIFLSYCQKDSDVADIIDASLTRQLEGKAKISRDIRDVEYHESFMRFMQSIESHDYVITIISDNYLKSRNCMFEMLEVVKNSSFGKKLAFIVLGNDDKQYYKTTPESNIGANVYSSTGIAYYTRYWADKEAELDAEIKAIGDPAYSVTLGKEKQIIKRILLDLSEFLEVVRDSKGLSLKQHIDNDFSDIIGFMNLK